MTPERTWSTRSGLSRPGLDTPTNSSSAARLVKRGFNPVAVTNRVVSMARPYVSAAIWSDDQSPRRACLSIPAITGASSNGTPTVGRPISRSAWVSETVP